MNNTSTPPLSVHWVRVAAALSSPFVAGGTAYALAPEEFKMTAAVAATGITLVTMAAATCVWIANDFAKTLEEFRGAGNGYDDNTGHAQSLQPR